MEVPGTVLERFKSSNEEIKWRVLQRDAIVVFALTLCGLMLAAGPVAVAAPVPLYFLGSMWLQHDRRAGSCARYRRKYIDPAMAAADHIPSWEDELNRLEPSRSYNRKLHFTAVNSRLLFPTLQLGMVAYGLVRLAQSFRHGHAVPWGWMWAIAVAGVAIAALTFTKVKHIR